MKIDRDNQGVSSNEPKPRKKPGKRMTDTFREFLRVKREEIMGEPSPKKSKRKRKPKRKKARLTDTLKGLVLKSKIEKIAPKQSVGTRTGNTGKASNGSGWGWLRGGVILACVVSGVAIVAVGVHFGNLRRLERERKLEAEKEAKRLADLAAVERVKREVEEERRRREAEKLALERQRRETRRLKEEWTDTIETVGNLLAASDDYWKARETLNTYQRKLKNPAYKKMAESKLALLDNLIWYVTRPTIEKLKRSADEALRKGARKEAVELLRNYSGELSKETKAERLSLAQTYSRLQLGDDERKRLEDAKKAVKLALSGGFKSAVALLEKHGDDRKTNEILEIVKPAANFDAKLVARFKKAKGGVVELKVDGKMRRARVLSVTGDQVTCELDFGGVKGKRTFRISKMPLREKARLSPDVSRESLALYVLTERLENLENDEFAKLAAQTGSMTPFLRQQFAVLKAESLANRLEKEGLASQAKGLTSVLNELAKADLSDREIDGVMNTAGEGLKRTTTYELISFSKIMEEVLRDILNSSRSVKMKDTKDAMVALDRKWIDETIRRIGEVAVPEEVPDTLRVCDFTVEWVEEAEKSPSRKRLRPDDFHFDKRKVENYLAGLPAELRKREGEALRRLAGIKNRLCGLLCAKPCEKTIKLKGGGVVKGRITGVNPKRLFIDTDEGRRDVEWGEISCGQFVEMHENFLSIEENRLAVSGSGGGSLARRMLADEYFNLFLLCAWYGEREKGVEMAAKAIFLDPGKIDETRELICVRQ